MNLPRLPEGLNVLCSETWVRSVVIASLISLTVLATGCASSQKDASRSETLVLEPLSISEPVQLRLNPSVGVAEKTRYFSQSTAQSYEDGEIRHRKEESVEFTAVTRALRVDAEKHSFVQETETIEKDGPIGLHAYGLPEKDESLEFELQTNGRVLRVGKYPPMTIFYVPAVSLPDEPVRQGDTWEMQTGWVTLEDRVPLEMSMVSILKGFYRCGTQRCADIEVSGSVTLLEKRELSSPNSPHFYSRFQGRLLLSLETGSVVWSLVKSQDRVEAGSVQKNETSCMESILVEPVAFKADTRDKPKCSVQN